MKTYKIEIKLVRAFSIGFTIHSPSLNGFYAEIKIACFTLALWSRGSHWLNAVNYWV